MKRLAFFQSDLRVGGVQKSLTNILKQIDYDTCQVDLYLYDREESFFDWPRHENLHVTYISPFARSIDRFIYFNIVRRLAKDVTGGKEYDVAVDFNSYQNECAAATINANARKKVMWVHNDMEIKLQNEPKYRVLWHFFKKKFPQYDAFAAVSPGIIDGFRRTTGVTDKPIVAIPNYIDTAEIFRKKDLPCPLTVDPGKLNLCSVGRLCHQKGYDLLMDILAEVKKKREDFMLYLIGDGPDRQALETQRDKLGLTNHVVFLGNQSNPFSYMDKMDGFVLTSRYEGQGMVIWEAKALGLPLYISKNLEQYNPGIVGCADMTQALIQAKKPAGKTRDDLADYNEAITRSLRALFEL